jgi:hypothetical protein
VQDLPRLGVGGRVDGGGLGRREVAQHAARQGGIEPQEKQRVMIPSRPNTVEYQGMPA